MADLLLRDTDRADLVREITAEVVAAIRPLLAETQEPRLVDRHRMADLLGISVPMLDRLTSEAVIPSVMAGRRRLYEPRRVIDAMPAAQTEGEPTDA